jgi:uncharacterized membrane protein YbhN (UPF0104 family)
MGGERLNPETPPEIPASGRSLSGMARWRGRSFWLSGGITIAFLVLVLALILPQARAIEWARVGTLLREFPAPSLLAALAVAACGHLVYSGFDLLGRSYTHHRLPRLQVMLVAFVSYAFNLNLGSLVGGVGFRYRLYSRLGLKNGVIARVIGMSLVTNWLGYMTLASLVFLLWPPLIPEKWLIGVGALRGFGLLFAAIVLGYLWCCAFSTRRSWTLRGAKLSLPTLHLLPRQFGLAMLNWMLMGGVIFLLLERAVEYPTVLGVLLLSSIATVISRIPAGLGVVEAVFVAALGPRVEEAALLAALILYRALYYLLPLALAALAYLRLELQAREQWREPQAPVVPGG